MSREGFMGLCCVVWNRVPVNASSREKDPQVTCVRTSQKRPLYEVVFNKHHVEYTEEWSRREYPEQEQGHERMGDTLETKTVGCGNCWYAEFLPDPTSKISSKERSRRLG